MPAANASTMVGIACPQSPYTSTKRRIQDVWTADQEEEDTVCNQPGVEMRERRITEIYPREC